MRAKMRGKAIDMDFVSAFIKECALANKTSPEEICNAANDKIEEINKQLKFRLKLTDVLSFFNYKKKQATIPESVLLFNNIDSALSKDIITIIKDNSLTDIAMLLANVPKEQKQSTILTLKQLLQTNVLIKNKDGVLSYGSRFQEFIKD